MQWALRAGRLFTPDGIVEDGVLLIRDGRLARVGRWGAVEIPGETPVHDLRPHSVAPGFIDLHVHGAVGHDFMDAEDEGFDAICAWHARGGTTGLLATTCAAPIARVRTVLERVGEWQARSNRGARVLGAHVEGPFFNMQMRGCHLPEYVRDPSPSDVAALLEHRSAMLHLTMAPELPGALDAVERLAGAGVSVAVAHSDATADQLFAAMDRGLRHATHLFNAMSYYHRRGVERISGVVEGALVRDDLSVELVADGIHVNPTRMALTVRAKGVERVCVVTDAMRGAGMPDGLYPFGPRDGKQAIVRDGIAAMPEGTGLASSTIPMVRCVQVMVEQVGVPLADALAMASANPARVAGVADRKGRLAEGMDADLVVLDDRLEVRMTVVAGEVVHHADHPEGGAPSAPGALPAR